MVISVVIIVFVLLQQTDEDSLSGIGAGASQRMLSKRSTSTPISKFTMILFVLFMLNSLLLATISARNINNGSFTNSELERFLETKQKEEEQLEKTQKSLQDLQKLTIPSTNNKSN
jgi:protein translocase SecG subunit